MWDQTREQIEAKFSRELEGVDRDRQKLLEERHKFESFLELKDAARKATANGNGAHGPQASRAEDEERHLASYILESFAALNPASGRKARDVAMHAKRLGFETDLDMVKLTRKTGGELWRLSQGSKAPLRQVGRGLYRKVG